MIFDALTISAAVITAVTIFAIIKLMALRKTKYHSDK